MKYIIILGGAAALGLGYFIRTKVEELEYKMELNSILE